MTRIAVLGAGAWGTAIACHLASRASALPSVVLWGRDGGQIATLRASAQNSKYLAGTGLPGELALTDNLADAISAADLILAAVPMGALPGLAAEALGCGAVAPLVWLAKGFVADQSLAAGVGLAHELIGPMWPAAVGVVSGPSFAEEVAKGLPTALAVAATDPKLAAETAHLLRGDTLRAYVSADLAGVEVGGAVKNVLAIAAGASDGLGFGHNARAALITRGLAETGRLSLALGGQRDTLMGLAGLGDLILTCTGNLSRNRRVGLALAQGKALPEILASLGHVAEGVPAARAVRTLAAHYGVEMPICEAVDRVLHDGLSPGVAVTELLRREPRPEGH